MMITPLDILREFFPEQLTEHQRRTDTVREVEADELCDVIDRILEQWEAEEQR